MMMMINTHTLSLFFFSLFTSLLSVPVDLFNTHQHAECEIDEKGIGKNSRFLITRGFYIRDTWSKENFSGVGKKREIVPQPRKFWTIYGREFFDYDKGKLFFFLFQSGRIF